MRFEQYIPSASLERKRRLEMAAARMREEKNSCGITWDLMLSIRRYNSCTFSERDAVQGGSFLSYFAAVYVSARRKGLKRVPTAAKLENFHPLSLPLLPRLPESRHFLSSLALLRHRSFLFERKKIQ